MKLVGITAIGTYYSPWFSYGLAAVYHVCDEIVVVNNGFDLSSGDWNLMPPGARYHLPLPDVAPVVKELDVNGKVHVVTEVKVEDLKKKMELGWEFERRAYDPEKPWVDVRGLNFQYAHEFAFSELAATTILKWDTDNVIYDGIEGLRNETKALQFYQYEFAGDLFHLSEPPPTDPYNDAPFMYFPTGKEWFYGGAGPMLYQERQRSNYKSAHLRQANPLNATEEEKFKHFYARAWFRIWTNEGVWGVDLHNKAMEQAQHMLQAKGTPTRARPPQVTLTTPKVYIEERSR